MCALALSLTAQITRPSQVETPAWMPVIAKLASALSQSDAPGALDSFDSHMKDYGEIEQNVSALVAQAEVLCAIDVVEDTAGPDGVRMLDADWYLQLKSLSDGGTAERRRQRVKIQVKLLRGHWKIISILPIGILEPLKIH